MKRKFRNIRTFLSVFLLLMTGIWLGLPRDVCLTKTFVDTDCTCVMVSEESEGTGCCASAKAGRSLPCLGQDNDGEVPADKHSSKCLMVSSALAKMTGAERIHYSVPVDVVAVLPFSGDLVQVYQPRFSLTEDLSPRISAAVPYRDNCVLLI